MGPIFGACGGPKFKLFLNYSWITLRPLRIFPPPVTGQIINKGGIRVQNLLMSARLGRCLRKLPYLRVWLGVREIVCENSRKLPCLRCWLLNTTVNVNLYYSWLSQLFPINSLIIILILYNDKQKGTFSKTELFSKVVGGFGSSENSTRNRLSDN